MMKIWKIFDLNFDKYSNNELKELIEEIHKRIFDLDFTIDKKKYEEYHYSDNVKVYEQIQLYLRAYIDVITSELKDREKRICNDCKKWGTKKCPNSSECYVLDAKPYFLDKSRKTLINKLIRYFVKKKINNRFKK